MRFTLLILLLIAGSAQAARITLKEDATLSGAVIRLGEVATITGRGAERLAGLPMGPSPIEGTQGFLSSIAIREMMAAQGEDPETHYFSGAYRVRVTKDGSQATPSTAPATTPRSARPSRRSNAGSTSFRIRRDAPSQRSNATRRLSPGQRRATEAAAVDAVQAALDQYINTDPASDRLAVRGVRLNQADLQSLSGKSLTAEWTMANKPAPGDFPVMLRSGDGGEPAKAVADLIVQPMRVVATGPIPRGALVIASMVRVEPTPLNELKRSTAIGFTGIDQAIGRETRRLVQPGEVLGEANTAAPLMVSRGEGVFVTVGGGGVTVRAQAIAKQEGRQGDLIPIELTDSGERVLARVVGPRRLAILSTGAVDPIALTGGIR